MTKREMVERTRQALENHRQLSADERAQRLIARGTIDENGVVLLDGEKPPRENNEPSSRREP